MPRDGLQQGFGNADDLAGCLPRGYRLNEFVIDRVIAEGGFGVVYSALDLRLKRRVAIKEYMPSLLARRAGDFSVQPRSSVRHQDAFAAGLRSFINEARLLAQFDHPSLVRVHQFWEDKGTGFIVMPRTRGRRSSSGSQPIRRRTKFGCALSSTGCSTRWRCCTRPTVCTATWPPTTSSC